MDYLPRIRETSDNFAGRNRFINIFLLGPIADMVILVTTAERNPYMFHIALYHALMNTSLPIIRELGIFKQKYKAHITILSDINTQEYVKSLRSDGLLKNKYYGDMNLIYLFYFSLSSFSTFLLSFLLSLFYSVFFCLSFPF